MKKWNKYFFVGLFLFITAFFVLILTTFLSINNAKDNFDHVARVKINEVLNKTNKDNLTKDKISYLDSEHFLHISYYYGSDENIKRDLINGKYLLSANEYIVKNYDDVLFVFEYKKETLSYTPIYVELIISISIVAVYIIFMVVIKNRVIKPFNKLTSYPEELARGNLDLELNADNNKLFGNYVWGMSNLRDTLREAKERELELNKQKAMIILSISHDIKTPLSSILLYSQALERDAIDKDSAAKNIINNTNKIKDYVDSLAESYSKSNYSVSLSDVYLDTLVGKLKEIYSLKLELLGISFSIAKYDNIIIKTDLFKLLEIFGNLIENAMKYGDGRYIKIDFQREGGFLIARVISSGATLNKNELDKIFNEFYRGSNSKNKKGSGLGLYICRELSRKLNGDIYAIETDDEIIMNVVSVIA